MRINVRGGTVKDGHRTLCESCRWSTVIRGARIGDEIVECTQLSFFNKRVRFPVTSCSDYLGRTQADLEEMEAVALIIKAEPRRTLAGFVNNGKPPEDRDVLRDE